MTNLSVHLAVSLGGPLPHQLADGTGAPPSTTGPCGSRPFNAKPCGFAFVSGISGRFQPLSRTEGQLALALLALPPLSKANIATNLGPFDLHASSTLPAFVLSQNQTLRRIEILRFRPGQARRSRSSFGFVLKFPSTNLLDCRAPPPAPRRCRRRVRWQMPEKAVPFSKSGALAPGLPARGGPLIWTRGPVAAQRPGNLAHAPRPVNGKMNSFLIIMRIAQERQSFESCGIVESGPGSGRAPACAPVSAPGRGAGLKESRSRRA